MCFWKLENQDKEKDKKIFAGHQKDVILFLLSGEVEALP